VVNYWAIAVVNYWVDEHTWSAKLPLSILTDFEEFAVYDCRVKPVRSDSASTARIMYLTFADYAAKWEDIVSVFGRDAVWQGSFDRYAEKTKGKKGTTEVDAAFLKEIEEWRDVLARTIALRNPSLTQRELNFAVQTTIDRVIFLRICEDRGIEDYGRLQGLLNGSGTYPRLLDLFRHADQRYNSGLFHFASERGRAEAPDELTPGLTIDDKALKDILKRLYYPDSPYEFSVLPADILGQVYEQFLGKVIRLTAGHRAVVEDKPEVKKAGGVYYTPTYIVDYIVKNTVGKLLEGSTPTKASALRILDPACGSGSFLIGAYQCLLDWHRDWYEQHSPEKHRKELYQGAGGVWRLSTSEKKRILLNNIYGVDIDSQAVETTKLSLLLKVLDGETQETINAQLSFLHERALPDLAANIKCGNSLIGPDFYDDQQLGLTGLDDEERYRINVFDWEAEFPQILGKAVLEERRGFDAVIGNPPWLMPGYGDKTPLGYLRSSYKSASGKFDLYYVFVERALDLLGADGRLGLIVPNKFFHTQAARELRVLLGKESGLCDLVDFGVSKVFRGATNYSCIILVDRAQSVELVRVCDAVAGLVVCRQFDVRRADLTGDPWHIAPAAARALADKLEATGTPLEQLVSRFATGVQSGADRILVLSPPEAKKLGLEDAMLAPVLRGRDVRRFCLTESPGLLVFPYRAEGDSFVLLREEELDMFPATKNYLFEHREALQRRVWFGKGPEELSGSWYGMMYLEPRSSIRRPHLLTPCLSGSSNFALGGHELFATGTAGVVGLVLREEIEESPAFLLGVLNSKLLSWYVAAHSPVFQGGYHKYSAPYLRSAPIRRTNNGPPGDRQAHDSISVVATTLESLYVQLRSSRVEHERRLIERQLDAAERRLDNLVYGLYGLIDDEIALVESSFEKE
jgi:hypothetical protein